MIVNAPVSEQELIRNASQLAGMSLQQLAGLYDLALPEDTRHAKGWLGQLVETSLGATAKSKARPDFELINVELKTLPVNSTGSPQESTYVCTVPLQEHEIHWETSWLRQKLSRVLWLPFEADKSIPLAERHIGSAILWSPSEREELQLRNDWEELMELVSLGKVDQITSHMGEVLQIRPKGANARSLTRTFDEEGNSILTLPRGFYLRPEFTQNIIHNHYA